MERPDWLNLMVLILGLALGLVLLIRAEQLAARSPAHRPTPARANRLTGAGALCIGLGTGVLWLDRHSPAAWDGTFAVLAAVLLVAMLGFLAAAVVVLMRARAGAR